MNIAFQSINIYAKNELKYVGVTIDAHVRCDIHINETTKTLRPLLYNMKYIRNILGNTHLNILYYALVE